MQQIVSGEVRRAQDQGLGVHDQPQVAAGLAGAPPAQLGPERSVTRIRDRLNYVENRHGNTAYTIRK